MRRMRRRRRKARGCEESGVCSHWACPSRQLPLPREACTRRSQTRGYTNLPTRTRRRPSPWKAPFRGLTASHPRRRPRRPPHQWRCRLRGAWFRYARRRALLILAQAWGESEGGGWRLAMKTRTRRTRRTKPHRLESGSGTGCRRFHIVRTRRRPTLEIPETQLPAHWKDAGHHASFFSPRPGDCC